MGRSRGEGLALLGCLLLASHCSGGLGGADSNVKVFMSDVVEAEIGKMAVIKCQSSIPENHGYTYVYWYSMEKDDKMERKKIGEMIQGKERHNDSEVKSRFSIASNFSLIINKVIPQDAKIYICRVGLGSPGVAENRTELRVSKAPEAPEILKENRGLTAGDSKKQEIAKCIVRNGYPTPSVTWYKDDESLDLDENETEVHFGVTKESSGLMTIQSTLLVRVTKEDRKARFHCQVNYLLMGINKTAESDPFSINVYYPSENITFEIEAPGPEVKEDDSVTLRCKADGNPEPLYTLYIVKGEQEEELPSDTGVHVFTSVKRENSGDYRCRALEFEFTSALELTKELTLSVNYIDAPSFSPSPPIHVDQGKDLQLTCNVKGSKPLEVHWEKKGVHVANGTQLILANMSYWLSGKYTCVATMPGLPNYSKSRQVLVTLNAKPLVVAQKHSGFVQVGDQVNFTCEVYSAPPVSISWSEANGTAHKIKHSHHHQISVFLVKITDSLLESGLNCSARNSKGESGHHFRLQQLPEMAGPIDRLGNGTSEKALEGTSGSRPEQEDISNFTLPESQTSQFGYNSTAVLLPPGGVLEEDFSNFTWPGNKTSQFGSNSTAGLPIPGGAQDGKAVEPEKKESKGVIIVAVIICILLIAVLGAVLYFLHKKGKLHCSRSGKQEITRPEAHKDEIVVEVKADKLPEEAGLLQGANGEKRSPGDQGEKYIDLRN